MTGDLGKSHIFLNWKIALAAFSRFFTVRNVQNVWNSFVALICFCDGIIVITTRTTVIVNDLITSKRHLLLVAGICFEGGSVWVLISKLVDGMFADVFNVAKRMWSSTEIWFYRRKPSGGMIRQGKNLARYLFWIFAQTKVFVAAVRILQFFAIPQCTKITWLLVTRWNCVCFILLVFFFIYFSKFRSFDPGIFLQRRRYNSRFKNVIIFLWKPSSLLTSGSEFPMSVVMWCLLWLENTKLFTWNDLNKVFK